MTVWKRRIIIGLFFLLVAIGAVVWVLRAPAPALAVVVPVPNGYDCISKSPALLTSPDEPPTRSDKDFSLARAKHYVTNNAAIMPLVQSALSNQWAVPIQFANDWMSEHCSHNLPQAKRIAQLFSCAGYVAEQEGRYHDAAKLYLDGLRFGSAVARGGLIIDSLVSVADERIALFPLDRLEPQLSADDCRFILAELEKWKANRESFQSVQEREKKWADVFGRLQIGAFRMELERVMEMIKTRSVYPQAAVIAKAKARYTAVVDQAQSLEVRLALRAFELERKTPAKGWADLIPTYLPVIPTNSETGRPLTHQF